MSRSRNLRRRRPVAVIVDEIAPPAPVSLADRFIGSETVRAPLTLWQQLKLRAAMGQALTLARWGVIR